MSRRHRTKPAGDLIAALDIGTTKVCCFIARVDEASGIRVAGIGHQVSAGLRAGAIVDMPAAQEAIAAAVNAAERMAGEQITSVVVNLPGGFPASEHVGVAIELGGRAITEADLFAAFARAQSTHAGRVNDGRPMTGVNTAPGPQAGSAGSAGAHHGTAGQDGRGGSERELIHAVPMDYRVDGAGGVTDPCGMYGERLGVDMHMVTATVGAVRNLVTCIERCHLEVACVVLAPYAAGLASLAADELTLGATVIDIGGGTTSIGVFTGDTCIYTDLVPCGGQHVTQDIARGLTTPQGEAERIKTLYGCAEAASVDERETIAVPQVGEDVVGGEASVRRSLLVGIIQPRLEEILEMVRQRLAASGLDQIAGQRVVLTGGAAQMPGLRELAARMLDKQVRVGKPVGIGGLAHLTGGPAFATTAGLLRYAVTRQWEIAAIEAAVAPYPRGMVARLKSWLKETL